MKINRDERRRRNNNNNKTRDEMKEETRRWRTQRKRERKCWKCLTDGCTCINNVRAIIRIALRLCDCIAHNSHFFFVFSFSPFLLVRFLLLFFIFSSLVRMNVNSRRCYPSQQSRKRSENVAGLMMMMKGKKPSRCNTEQKTNETVECINKNGKYVIFFL